MNDLNPKCSMRNWGCMIMICFYGIVLIFASHSSCNRVFILLICASIVTLNFYYILIWAFLVQLSLSSCHLETGEGVLLYYNLIDSFIGFWNCSGTHLNDYRYISDAVVCFLWNAKKLTWPNLYSIFRGFIA